MDAGGHTEKGQVALAHLQSCVGSRIQNSPEHIQLLLLEFLLTVHHVHDAAATALAFGLQQSTTGSSIPLPARRKGHLGGERWAVLWGHSLGTAEQLPAAQPRTAVSSLLLKEGGTHSGTRHSPPSSIGSAIASNQTEGEQEGQAICVYHPTLQGNRSLQCCPAHPCLALLAEILVLGTGDRVERLHPAMMKQMRERGIAVEVQDTANACATFNFLMNEGRVVAAGLIPPRGT
uniref:NADH dehydrogenase [ubiquinone] 1 alpha subcomplex assembly factor 3 n=1 Tax=Zonotrichia albicollis TaxID=44394 RepID=A0A8D2M4C2_ZONAL